MRNYLWVCKEAAVAGGSAIANFRSGSAETKGDVYVGHHAVVTPADYRSQKAVLNRIIREDPTGLFITEEIVKDEGFVSRIVGQNNLDRLRDSRVYVIDELDGTSSHDRGHYEWSVSVGCVEKMEHISGAVFAPAIGEGTLFLASKGGGAFVRTRSEEKECVIEDRKLNDAYVLFGVDCPLPKYPLHNRLLVEVADKARTTNLNGSCALGLGLVASGAADVLVQPLQSPWDWAAGKVLVEEAGGKMIFYEISEGRIKAVETLEPRHYDPTKRAVGFVAGSERLSEAVFGMLQRIRVS